MREATEETLELKALPKMGDVKNVQSSLKKADEV